MMIGGHSVLVHPLETAQPLAHRLLKSLLVRCPLHASVDCEWRGDYGDLESHLLSSTAHSDIPDDIETVKQRILSLAGSLKVEANGKFESKHFREAQSLYTKAMQVLQQQHPELTASDPQAKALLATLYSNRAATFLQSQDFPKCLQDCLVVIDRKLDDTNIKVYIRASRACLQMGDLSQGKRILERGMRSNLNNGTLSKELKNIDKLSDAECKGREYLTSAQFASAKGTFGSLLKEGPSAAPWLLGAAEADLGLGLTDSSLRLTKRVLVQHAQNPLGCWIRGRALFIMGDFQLGLQFLQEALRLDPDSLSFRHSYRQAKQVHEWMDLAQKSSFSRRFQDAYDLLTRCLETYNPLPTKSKLYATLRTQRAETNLRLKKYAEAMKDCALVVYAQDDCIPAWLIRFQSHHGLGEHSAVLEQVKDLLQKWPQETRLRDALERADFFVRKEKRVDYYKLLDVASIASTMEIKKAYKRKALVLHPDKLPPGSSPDEQRRGQKRFQLLGEGLEILTDDFQRKLYDEGYDPEAIRDRIEAAKQAAHNHRGGFPHHHGHPNAHY
jgi:DnaJ family protein C protein 7